MADVEMTDAPIAKAPKAAAGGDLDGKKRFEVKKVRKGSCICDLTLNTDGSQWNAVALWAWDIVVDNCAICRNHIMDLCRSTLSHPHMT